MIHFSADEALDRAVRKHWFILLRDVIGVVLIALLPFALYGYLVYAPLPETLPNTLSRAGALPAPWLAFIASAWLAVWWAKLFGVWTDYYLDVWAVTNRRIIDVEQRGFFNREVASFRIERIQDVTIEINGLIPTLLNFGTIHVQTAGVAQEFRIKGIPNPEAVKQKILDRYAKRMEELKETGADGADAV